MKLPFEQAVGPEQSIRPWRPPVAGPAEEPAQAASLAIELDDAVLGAQRHQDGVVAGVIAGAVGMGPVHRARIAAHTPVVRPAAIADALGIEQVEQAPLVDL